MNEITYFWRPKNFPFAGIPWSGAHPVTFVEIRNSKFFDEGIWGWAYIEDKSEGIRGTQAVFRLSGDTDCNEELPAVAVQRIMRMLDFLLSENSERTGEILLVDFFTIPSARLSNSLSWSKPASLGWLVQLVLLALGFNKCARNTKMLVSIHSKSHSQIQNRHGPLFKPTYKFFSFSKGAFSEFQKDFRACGPGQECSATRWNLQPRIDTFSHFT